MVNFHHNLRRGVASLTEPKSDHLLSPAHAAANQDRPRRRGAPRLNIPLLVVVAVALALPSGCATHPAPAATLASAPVPVKDHSGFDAALENVRQELGDVSPSRGHAPAQTDVAVDDRFHHREVDDQVLASNRDCLSVAKERW
jgi:hypothetical protein